MTKLQPYADYEDTGVDWLGQLPTHWNVVPSKWLFSLRTERPAPGAVHLMASQKYGVISQAQFMAEKDQRVVQTIVGGENMKRICVNDFLIHLRSFQGGIEWSANEGKVSPAYTVLTPNKSVHPPFFYYLLKSEGYIQELRATTNQLRDGQSMNYSQFAMVPLIEVPWNEQVAIADFLDRETAQIDELIGKQERLIELLAEKRQAIITHAVTKGLDPTAPTKPSGIPWQGPVPEHWTVQPLKNLMRMQTGVTLGKEFSDVETETYAYLRVANVQIGYVDLRDVKEIDLPTEVAASSMLQPGDVLMTEGGDRDKLARGCIWDGSISPCVHQNHIFAVRTGPQLLNNFLVLLLDADPARAYFYLTGKQSTNLASTNSTTVKNFRFGVPPISEQRRIVTHMKTKTLQIDDLVEKAKAVISTLKERRSALISAAVTGKIEVGSS